MASQPNRDNPFRSKEFVLVFVLVIALLLSVLMIFGFSTGTDRKDLLAIVLGAFGAWIGAGAAYFFGRENLNAATESMLRMRGVSPQERLLQTTLRDMKPKPLPVTFLRSSGLDKVLEWLEQEPERFFVVVLNDQSKLANAVDEEAIYRYLHQNNPGPEQRTLGHVVDYVKGLASGLEKDSRPDAAKATLAMVDAAVILKDTQTAAFANEMMEHERKFVTIVTDDKGVALGYITTSHIRHLVLSSSS